jgi:microcystin-dependent protein
MASESYLGCIFLFAGNFAPRGFALCQGQIISIAQNTALFSLLGTTYGGNGQTTFALPDLRGRAAVGAGQGPGLPNYALGEVTGSPTVSLTISEMPAHNHLVSASQNADSTNPQACFPGNDSRGGSPLNIYSTTADTTLMNPAAVQPAGGSQPFSVQNPILALNYIICTQGLFPSRN